ncbi:MAG: gamma-glutamyl-gamma-aminobutyrate hydrolase family protein [Acidimicrobiales bacterium]
MNRRPLVAVPGYHLAAGRVRDWARGGYAVPEAYVSALVRAGAQPVVLPAAGPASAAELLAPFDGLMLAGGGDIDPARYGARPHASVYGVDTERDQMELALATEALATGLPILAICRGFQIVNVARGGTLHQHLPELQGMDLHGLPTKGTSVVHDVTVASGTRLAEACGAEVLRCTSHHHQGVDRLGTGLVAVAWSDDGLIEAVEVSSGGCGWLVAVQWHPEMTAADDAAQQALFGALARVAGR